MEFLASSLEDRRIEETNGAEPADCRQKLIMAQKKRQDAAEALLDALHLDSRNQTLLMAQEDMARKAQIDSLQADGLRLMIDEHNYSDAANKFNKALLEMSTEQKDFKRKRAFLKRPADQTFA